MSRRLSFHLRTHRHATSNPSDSPSSSNSGSVIDPTMLSAGQGTGQYPQDANAPAVIAARAEIRSRTRSDWTFPLPEQPFDLRITPSTSYVPRRTDPLSPSPSPSPLAHTAAERAAAAPAGWRPSAKSLVQAAPDPYRFQDPDAVGKSIVERKRKRRREEKEELCANKGLRIFEERRDAWTGSVRIRGTRGRQMVHEDIGALVEKNKGKMARKKTITSSPVTNIASGDNEDMRGEENEASKLVLAMGETKLDHTSQMPKDTSSAGRISTSSSVSESGSHSDQDSGSDSDDTTAMTPQPQPLLPETHPNRILLTPRAYPTIYSRVVVQSNAPRLPIPLQHVINACVEGWKTDGEWPPKQGKLEPLVGRKKEPIGVLGRGVRRVLRIVKGDGDEKAGGREKGEGARVEVAGI